MSPWIYKWVCLTISIEFEVDSEKVKHFESKYIKKIPIDRTLIYTQGTLVMCEYFHSRCDIEQLLWSGFYGKATS